MSDLEEEMYYTWSDKTDVTFTSWYYNEPNNSGDEDCVEVYYNVRIILHVTRSSGMSWILEICDSTH